MKASPKAKIKVGVFTIAGIVLLMVGIVLIGSRKNMFGAKYTIYGTFRNVGGLQPGNAVRFNGINVGTIQSIDITSDSSVTVAMSVQKRVQRYIKTDAIANIGSDGLMGDKLIIITPGTTGVTALADGARIQTTNPVDFEKSIAKFNKVVDNATAITAAVADISGQIRSGQGSLGRLIYDDKLERGLEQTVYTTNSITATVAGIAGQLTSGKGSMGRLLYSDSLARGLEETVSTARKTMNEAHSTVTAVHDAVATTRQTLDSARLTISSARRGAEGFADNMDAVKHSFLLRGYFKKKERADKAQRDEYRMVKEQAHNDKAWAGHAKAAPAPTADDSIEAAPLIGIVP